MKGRTRTITLSALLTALTVVFLYLGNILPTVRLGFTAASSLFAVAAVIECGLGAAVFVFIGSSVLGALILPDKTPILLYALFFGYYPIIKSLAERLHSFILNWALKVGVFNAALTAAWFLFRSIFFNAALLETSGIVIYAGGNLAFVLFDIGMTRLIGLYIVRISRQIRKSNM